MAGLQFSSGVDKGFEKDLKRMNTQMNSLSSNVEKKNSFMQKSFAGLGATIAATLTAREIISFGKESVALYREQAKALAQVEQGLISTGNTANQTFEGLQKEASDLQKNTLFGDEEILKDATAQLLTFTNIANDNFIRTQKAALDLSTRLGGDLKSSAIQLGKALNDPVANLSALSRSGIQFSDEQKTVIKDLAETNRLAEAQTLILEELERQYGGSAAAAAKADGGITQLNNAIGDAKEVVGGLLLEGMQPLIQELKSFFENLKPEDIRKFISNVKDGVEIVGILTAGIVAWKLSVIAMNKIQKINTFLTSASIASQKASALSGKTVTKGNYLMAKSFKSLKAAFAANPIGLLVTGLTLAIPLISKFISGLEETDKISQDLSDVTRTTNTNLANQTSELRRLQAQLENTQPKSEARKKVIDDINKAYPDLLKNIDTEKTSLDDLSRVFDTYISNLEKTIRLKALQTKFESLISDEIENQAEEDANARYAKKLELDERKSAILEEIGYQKNIVDVSQKYADLIKEQSKLIKERDLNNSITGIESQIQTYEQFVDRYIALNTQLINGQPITPEFSDKELDDAYLSYVGNNKKIIEDREKTKYRLAQIQKEIEDELKAPTKEVIETTTVLTDEQSEAIRKDSLKALELSNQKEINEITNNYGNRENLEKQFNERILHQKIEYLTKLKSLTKDQLDKLRIEEDIINLKAQQNIKESNQKELDSLLEKYRSYAQKREDLIINANENIEKLQGIEGSTEAIEEIKKELEENLSNLDIQFYSEETGLSELFKNDKERSLEQVQELVDGTKDLLSDLSTGEYNKDNYFGLSEKIFEQIKESPAAIKKIQQLFDDLSNSSLKSTNGSFEKSIDLLGNINTLADDLSASLGEGSDSASILGKGLLDAASNTVGLVQAIKAIGQATGALETASGVLAIISAIVKVIGAVNNAIKDAEEQKVQSYIKELQYIHEINLRLIEQIALYKEGDEFFASDKWGGALAGLNAYNEALAYQKKIIDDIANSDQTAVIDDVKAQPLKEDALSNVLSGLSYSDIISNALGSVVVKTKDKSGFANAFGFGDEYSTLLNLYPELIDANSDLNTSVLQTVIDTENLTDTNKEMLQELLEATDAAEAAYQSFGDYISGIFGGVADEVTSAFQEMYENMDDEGSDAMKNLEQSFSDMIESFTRDAIEFAYLQPLITELNDVTKGLGVDFAKGEIDADTLQSSIINELGSFYDSLNELQPSILDAYKSADELAAAAGFDSAFNGDTTENDLSEATTSISDSITEQTGTEIKGRMNAIMISNQIISEKSQQMLTYAVQNLVTLNKIKENTDYLPEIARNTKRTADSL